MNRNHRFRLHCHLNFEKLPDTFVPVATWSEPTLHYNVVSSIMASRPIEVSTRTGRKATFSLPTCWETRRKGGRLHPFGNGVVLCLGLLRLRLVCLSALNQGKQAEKCFGRRVVYICWFMPGIQAFGAICGSWSLLLLFPVPLIAFAEVLLGLTSLIAVLLLVFAPDPSSELVEPWHTLMSMIYQYVLKERIWEGYEYTNYYVQLHTDT